MLKFSIYKLPNPLLKKLSKIHRTFSGFAKSSTSESSSINEYQNHRPAGKMKKICYAPYRSIYFSANGNVNPCCLNRSHIYGKWPENSIQQIWNNKKMLELKDALSCYDFSKGCFQCKQRIENGNFDAVEAILYDKLPPSRKFPLMMEFELSNKCNLNCLMCTPELSSGVRRHYNPQNPIISVYNQIFIKELEPFIPYLYRTKFLGGEPFFIDIYFNIWEKILSMNPSCEIQIQTNGTILNSSIKDLLSRGNFRVSVSIDSFEKENYQNIRRGSSFSSTLDNIFWFAEYANKKKYPFGISVCPIQQNWDELPEIVEKCNELDAIIYFNTVWYPSNCSLFSLSPEKLQNVIKTLQQARLSGHSPVTKKNKYHFECMINHLIAWQKQKENEFAEKKKKYSDWNKFKTELEKTTLENLINELKSKLSAHFSDPLKEKESEILIHTFREVLKQFNEDLYLKLAIMKLIEFPAEIIIQELKTSNIRKLTEQAANIIADCKKEETKLFESY